MLSPIFSIWKRTPQKRGWFRDFPVIAYIPRTYTSDVYPVFHIFGKQHQKTRLISRVYSDCLYTPHLLIRCWPRFSYIWKTTPKNGVDFESFQWLPIHPALTHQMLTPIFIYLEITPKTRGWFRDFPVIAYMLRTYTSDVYPVFHIFGKQHQKTRLISRVYSDCLYTPHLLIRFWPRFSYIWKTTPKNGVDFGSFQWLPIHPALTHQMLTPIFSIWKITPNNGVDFESFQWLPIHPALTHRMLTPFFIYLENNTKKTGLISGLSSDCLYTPHLHIGCWPPFSVFEKQHQQNGVDFGSFQWLPIYPHLHIRCWPRFSYIWKITPKNGVDFESFQWLPIHPALTHQMLTPIFIYLENNTKKTEWISGVSSDCLYTPHLHIGCWPRFSYIWKKTPKKRGWFREFPVIAYIPRTYLSDFDPDFHIFEKITPKNGVDFGSFQWLPIHPALTHQMLTPIFSIWKRTPKKRGWFRDFPVIAYIPRTYTSDVYPVFHIFGKQHQKTRLISRVYSDCLYTPHLLIRCWPRFSYIWKTTPKNGVDFGSFQWLPIHPALTHQMLTAA